jgi:hypothetical protein
MKIIAVTNIEGEVGIATTGVKCIQALTTNRRGP